LTVISDTIENKWTVLEGYVQLLFGVKGREIWKQKHQP